MGREPSRGCSAYAFVQRRLQDVPAIAARLGWPGNRSWRDAHSPARPIRHAGASPRDACSTCRHAQVRAPTPRPSAGVTLTTYCKGCHRRRSMWSRRATPACRYTLLVYWRPAPCASAPPEPAARNPRGGPKPRGPGIQLSFRRKVRLPRRQMRATSPCPSEGRHCRHDHRDDHRCARSLRLYRNATSPSLSRSLRSSGRRMGLWFGFGRPPAS